MEGTDLEERRQFVRLDTRLETSYTVLPSGTAKAIVTKDIGGGGVCLFADKPMAPGTRLQVSMKLPGRETPVHFTGEVIWSEEYEVIGKTQRQKSVEAGVRFVEISPQDREAVLQHVILSLKQPG